MTIINNTFYNISSNFIYIWEGDDLIVTNNLISDGTGTGIYFKPGNRSTIFNNTITRIRHDYGLFVVTGSSYNYTNNFTDNNISNNWNSTGAYLANDGFGHIYERNIVQNNSIGFDLSTFNYGNISHSRILDNTKGIEMNSQLVEGRVYHSTFSNNDFEVQSDSGPNYGNITLVNSSFNRSRLQVGATQYVYVKTLVYFNVTNNGVALGNASVEAIDVQDNADVNGTTSGSGELTLEIEPFYHNNKINYLNSPTTIRVTKNNFTRNVSVIEFLNYTDKQVNATLGEIFCSSSISTTFQMGDNYQCLSNGFHVTANDITLFGKDKNLTGNLYLEQQLLFYVFLPCYSKSF